MKARTTRPLDIAERQAGWFADEVDQALARGGRVVMCRRDLRSQTREDFGGPGVDIWRNAVQARGAGAVDCGRTHLDFRGRDPGSLAGPAGRRPRW